jgi:hypothetical protein
MPVIARFYGISVKMYFKEHGIPHFHAIYNEFNGVFNVETLEMIEGDLPGKAKQLILEWAKIHKNELIDMWKTQHYQQLPGLE